MSRVVKRILTGLVAAVVASAGVLISAGPAHAAVVYNYISLPTWLGNCPGGGSVKYLQVSTWALEGSGYAADAGDDLVYLSVGLNMDNTVVAQGLCYKGSQTYWGPASSQTIRPSRGGQTWWVGPGGVSHN